MEKWLDAELDMAKRDKTRRIERKRLRPKDTCPRTCSRRITSEPGPPERPPKKRKAEKAHPKFERLKRHFENYGGLIAAKASAEAFLLGIDLSLKFVGNYCNRAMEAVPEKLEIAKLKDEAANLKDDSDAVRVAQSYGMDTSAYVAANRTAFEEYPKLSRDIDTITILQQHPYQSVDYDSVRWWEDWKRSSSDRPEGRDLDQSRVEAVAFCAQKFVVPIEAEFRKIVGEPGYRELFEGREGVVPFSEEDVGRSYFECAETAPVVDGRLSSDRGALSDWANAAARNPLACMDELSKLPQTSERDSYLYALSNVAAKNDVVRESLEKGSPEASLSAALTLEGKNENVKISERFKRTVSVGYAKGYLTRAGEAKSKRFRRVSKTPLLSEGKKLGEFLGKKMTEKYARLNEKIGSTTEEQSAKIRFTQELQKTCLFSKRVAGLADLVKSHFWREGTSVTLESVVDELRDSESKMYHDLLAKKRRYELDRNNETFLLNSVSLTFSLVKFLLEACDYGTGSAFSAGMVLKSCLDLFWLDFSESVSEMWWKDGGATKESDVSEEEKKAFLDEVLTPVLHQRKLLLSRDQKKLDEVTKISMRLIMGEKSGLLTTGYRDWILKRRRNAFVKNLSVAKRAIDAGYFFCVVASVVSVVSAGTILYSITAVASFAVAAYSLGQVGISRRKTCVPGFVWTAAVPVLLMLGLGAYVYYPYLGPLLATGATLSAALTGVLEDLPILGPKRSFPPSPIPRARSLKSC